MIANIQRHGGKIGIFVAVTLSLVCVYFIRNLSASEVFVQSASPYEYREETVASVPLLFTGDIMLGRYVETLMNRYGQNYPFGSTTEFLKSHTTIANLEGSIPKVHIPTKINTMVFSFPPETPTILKNNGIQAVSLANNHSLDSGAVGYEETKRSLENGGIIHFGGYSTTLTEHFETHVGTTSVIVYGINMISSTWDKEMAYSATELLRKQYPKSILIAQLHWGNEYALTQGDEQRVLAYKFIDRGVDVIVGSHPHVVQGIEVYKGAPIFYSLGNFIFDQYFSRDVERGYLLSLDKKDGEILYTIIPVVSKRSQVAFPSEEIKVEILETIAKSSDASLKKNINESEILLPFLR